MKKFLSMFLLVMFAVGAMAQSPVYRVGDKYMMDGSVMNKREFKGYLKNTCPEAFELFDNGHKLSIAGWSCFGIGLAVNSVGSSILTSCLRGQITQDYMLDISYSLTTLGAGITVAGVTCLAVGYTRMHKAVNLYNIEKAKRPDLRWVFGMNRNGGMAVALQF
ncbi:MAG: hypothetical protein IJ047_06520 [Paludibacteraceae bacterium]|nr:hypothetical protein [Paludibacteraceae bacterium]MBQ8939863.1 hypothetical protein [Paludibacteraceae bacterium]